MAKQIKPDLTLLKLPSLHAIRTFVAAARYLNFTRAAESLCVSQAAVSRQIRDLEEDLKTDLLIRKGRAVELTSAGSLLFDTVQLSLGNISRATERIRGKANLKKTVTLCCSPSVSRFLLAPRVPAFLKLNPSININILTTHSFFSLDVGVEPDFFITKWNRALSGYSSLPLISDVIYPVCPPKYSEKYLQSGSLHEILNSSLLSLTPYGRSQVDEHVDWSLWFGYHSVDWKDRQAKTADLMTNDYSTIIDLAVNHQGIALGWNFLVGPLIENGLLTRPLQESMALSETMHYLGVRDDKANDEACLRFHLWLVEQFKEMEASPIYQ